MRVETPIITTGEVRPEWIDYNGHLMDGYYAVACSAVTDRFLELVGFGPAYPAATGHSVYTVESHLVYLREVRAGAALSYATLLLAHDDRRIQLVHTMLDGGRPAATNELLLVHVRQEPPAVVPMPAAAIAALSRIAAAHAAHPRPTQVGRHVALRQAAAEGSTPREQAPAGQPPRLHHRPRPGARPLATA